MEARLYRGWWYAYWKDEHGETRRRALRTKDRDEALRIIADFRKARPGDTVGVIYKAYLEEKGTERANWAWKHLEPAFAHLTPGQIDRARCRDYAAARRRAGVGDGTIHTEMTFLRAALRWQDRNTPADVLLPSKPPPMDRHLTRAQYAALLTAATVPHIRLFIILALATAGRSAAILDLTWDRVDFTKGVIRLGLGDKRRKGRATVPMTDQAREALLEAAKSRTSEFVIEYGGGQVARVRKGFAAAANAAGVPWCTPHVLRHTAAVWMAEARVPMTEIARYLGHSDSRITERVYAVHTPDHLRKAAAALG